MILKKVKYVLRISSMVTSCVIVAVAVYTTMCSHAESVSSLLLWQIPIISVLCAAGSLIYPWDVAMSKTEMGIRIFLHYLYINVIVLGAGWLCEWYDIKSIKSILLVVVSIAIIFIVVSMFAWGHGAGEAKSMNEKLQEYQQEKDE